MAGTARTVPATRPLTTSWAVSSTGTLTSDELHELELAPLRLVEADLAVEDVADVGEVARTARALVVDRLALGEELEALDGVVDLDAVALQDAAHVILDGRAGRLALGVSDGQQDEADVIVALARIRIEVVRAEDLGEALVAGRLDRRRRRGRVRAVGHLAGQRSEQLGVDRIPLCDLAARVAGLEQLLQKDGAVRLVAVQIHQVRLRPHGLVDLRAERRLVLVVDDLAHQLGPALGQNLAEARVRRRREGRLGGEDEDALDLE